MGMAIILTLIALSSVSHAIPPVSSNVRGIAIDGYDPVAYFTLKKPVKGRANYRYYWNKSTWLFANYTNQQLFKKKPRQYAPRYGGYCAFTMSYGGAAKADPRVWHIFQNKLYLTLNSDIKKKWLEEIINHIKRGDKYWKKLGAK